MARFGFIIAAMLVTAPVPASGSEADGCGDCFRAFAAGEGRALAISIESGITFSRLGLRGKEDGEAAIDPQTGAKKVGTNMIDLGGVSFQGKARITGKPLKPVRIELPHIVRLRSPSGAEAELRDFTTDLPPVAMLDAEGRLEFSFGATISSKDAQGGNFRGRIPIRVEYY